MIGIDPLTRRVSIAAYEAELNMIIHSLGGEMTLMIDAGAIQITADTARIEDIGTAMVRFFHRIAGYPDDGFGAGRASPTSRKQRRDGNTFRFQRNASAS